MILINREVIRWRRNGPASGFKSLRRKRVPQSTLLDFKPMSGIVRMASVLAPETSNGTVTDA